MRWFDRCFEMRHTPYGIQWVQVALPYPGGAADQPEWLMKALAVLQRVNDDISSERLSERLPEKKPNVRR